MLGSSMRRVGLIDITVGNVTRLGASQRSATRRCASQHHRYATPEPLGKPGGSRAFSADGPLNRLWLRDAYRSQPEVETEEI